MTLKRVTLTGADDSVDPQELLTLSEEYPFVEWGILVSKAHTGSPRYPSHAWINILQSRVYNLPFEPTTKDCVVNLSLHICGRWVRDLLIGELTFPLWIAQEFKRVQLNFHAERTPCKPKEFVRTLEWFGDRDIIFQVDGANGNQHLDSAWEHEANNCYPLFDVSGGAGITPNEWPKPQWMVDDESHCLHGYAGGLGPENVVSEYHRILEAAGADTPIWIDMETRLFSNGGTQFDMTKCRSVLEQMKPFIDQGA